MGWEMAKRLKREGTNVHLWLFHVDVWQRPTQYCKASILKLKNRIEEKSMIVLKDDFKHLTYLRMPIIFYWIKMKSGFDVIIAAAAKSLQSCLTLCDPIDGSPPGSPSLGFSRQEHWSGWPFPSPVHESEKWKWSHSVISDSSRPQGLQPTRLLRPWDFPGKSIGVGCHCLLQGELGRWS